VQVARSQDRAALRLRSLDERYALVARKEPPMALVEQVKKAVEAATGLGRPRRPELPSLVKPRAPRRYCFEDDGETPNNRLPLVIYRDAVRRRRGLDPAAIYEALFAANGWKKSWRDGLYDFIHFHTRTHEVLGIARGAARVQFGGLKGRTLSIKAGDVVILPAGTGHCRISASEDLLVVGAYPAAGAYDEPKPGEVSHKLALTRIAKVRRPARDPVYGKEGPLKEAWKDPPRRR
jgi:uncharacterized protein YjlB